MISNNFIKKSVIIVMAIMMLCLLWAGSVAAQGTEGPKTISGRVYNSDGKQLGGDLDKYNGTYAAVIVEHKGTKTTYKDLNGLEQDENLNYWYVVTIPAGAWSPDDTYWIEVDGTGWDDQDFTCSGHGNPDVNSWKMDATGSEGRDVNTADYNFTPLLAWIFAIIIGVFGIVIGIIRPLKIPSSGWPQQPSDLVDEITIAGAEKMQKETPMTAAAAQPTAAPMAAAEPQPTAAPMVAAATPAVAAPVAAAAQPSVAAPAAAAAPIAQEHMCTTCGQKMEFIQEYDSWYCYTCQKYEGEESPPPGPTPGGGA